MDCAVAVGYRVALALLQCQGCLLSSRPTAHLDRPKKDHGTDQVKQKNYRDRTK